jgi:hypothetical protein
VPTVDLRNPSGIASRGRGSAFCEHLRREHLRWS